MARRSAGLAVLASLGVGVLVGPVGFRLLDPALTEDGNLIEAVSQVALVVVVFCVGLRLPQTFDWKVWRAPVRLATFTMPATVLLAAGIAYVLLGMSFAHAMLLAAILAPTDPALGADVPLPPNADRESTRFTLAAEGGINSGLALAAVLFGLGLAGRNDLGPLALKWLTLDFAWSVGGALVIGWVVGTLLTRGSIRLDTRRQGAELPEELLAVTTLVVGYGAAYAASVDPFLAVFAAGLALSHRGRLRPTVTRRGLSTRLTQLALRLERFAAATIVVLLGAMLAVADIRLDMLLFALLLLLMVRPLAVRVGLAGLPVDTEERRLVGWFGVRGTASIYCLMWAVNQGLATPLARELAAITIVTVVVSVILHEVSATPLLGRRAADMRS